MPKSAIVCPLLLSQKEVDILYELYERIHEALVSLKVNYILIAGSLLGAIRSQSILFNDDDIDIAVLSPEDYHRVLQKLPPLISKFAWYKRRPWPAADKIRAKAAPYIWIDVFVLKRFDCFADIYSMIRFKDNGKEQSYEYVAAILEPLISAAVTISTQQHTTSRVNNLKEACLLVTSGYITGSPVVESVEAASISADRLVRTLCDNLHSGYPGCSDSNVRFNEKKSSNTPAVSTFNNDHDFYDATTAGAESLSSIIAHLEAVLFPIWHYDTRKAVECWPREFFTQSELFQSRTAELFQSRTAASPDTDTGVQPASAERFPIGTAAPPFPSLLQFGHLLVPGPARPVSYLKRAYGHTCFREYPVNADHSRWVKEFRGRRRTDKDDEEDTEKKPASSATDQQDNRHEKEQGISGSSDTDDDDDGRVYSSSEKASCDQILLLNNDKNDICVSSITAAVEQETATAPYTTAAAAADTTLATVTAVTSTTSIDKAEHNSFIESASSGSANKLLPLLPEHYLPMLHSRYHRSKDYQHQRYQHHGLLQYAPLISSTLDSPIEVEEEVGEGDAALKCDELDEVHNYRPPLRLAGLEGLLQYLNSINEEF